jgi:ELWxxDGT repeat protein
MRNIVLIISVLLGINCSVNAQIPSLLKDINTVGGYNNPNGFVKLNGIIYFPFDDNIHGSELWRSDGTTAGTYMVKDIYPGAQSGVNSYEVPIVFQNKLFFHAKDPNSWYEIFTSDGTSTGTNSVTNFSTNNNDTNIGKLVNCGDYKMVFSAQTTAYGYELWQSDGTFTGTTLLADFTSGPNNTGIDQVLYTPSFLGGTIFVKIGNPTAAVGIWRSSFGCFIGCGAFSTPTKIPNTENAGNAFAHTNTATQHTELYLQDINTFNLSKYDLNDNTLTQLTNFPATPPNYNGSFLELNNIIYFTGRDVTNGSELWKTDGTVAGTAFLKDISAGTGSTYIGKFIEIGGNAYFTAKTSINGISLWKTDGTAAGTVELTNISPSNSTIVGYELKNSGANIYYTTSISLGNFLYETSINAYNITTNQKTVIKNFGDLPNYDAGDDEIGSIGLNSDFIFVGYEPAIGFEIWKTNGTVAGTELLKDIGKGSSFGSNFLINSGATHTAYFLASDLAGNYPQLHKIESGTIVSKVSNRIMQNLIELNANTMLFTTYDNTFGEELWKTDGTEAGTQLVKDIFPGQRSSNLTDFTKFNNLMVFRAKDNSSDYELWVSDGSAAGTFRLKDIRPGSNGSTPSNFVECNGFVYFSADDGTNGYELWRTDGTSAGTILVKDIVPGASDSYPSKLTKAGNRVFFTANEPSSNRELWVTDGTAAGTYLVKDIRPGNLSSDIEELTAIGDNVFFSANNGTQGRELWRSSGNNVTTSPYNINAEQIVLGSVLIESSNPKNLTALGNKLYFSAEQTIYSNPLVTYGRELWSYTMGDASPVIVKNANPNTGNLDGIAFDFNGKFKNLGNIIYYPATDGQHGFELWRSDGTAVGTFMVQDTYQGLGDGIDYRNNVEMIGNPFSGFFYYNATNGQNGHELWSFGQCKVAQNITETLAASSQRQQSSQFLTSSSNITNTNTSYGNLDINYRAGKAITLLPGFSVEGIKLPQNRKSVFKAEIGGCNY